MGALAIFTSKLGSMGKESTGVGRSAGGTVGLEDYDAICLFMRGTFRSGRRDLRRRPAGKSNTCQRIDGLCGAAGAGDLLVQAPQLCPPRPALAGGCPGG